MGSAQAQAATGFVEHDKVVARALHFGESDQHAHIIDRASPAHARPSETGSSAHQQLDAPVARPGLVGVAGQQGRTRAPGFDVHGLGRQAAPHQFVAHPQRALGGQGRAVVGLRAVVAVALDAGLPVTFTGQIQMNGKDDRWFVRGFIQNIANNNAATGLYVTDQSSGLFTNICTLEPRLYGVAAGFKF